MSDYFLSLKYMTESVTLWCKSTIQFWFHLISFSIDYKVYGSPSNLLHTFKMYNTVCAFALAKYLTHSQSMTISVNHAPLHTAIHTVYGSVGKTLFTGI